MPSDSRPPVAWGVGDRRYPWVDDMLRDNWHIKVPPRWEIQDVTEKELLRKLKKAHEGLTTDLEAKMELQKQVYKLTVEGFKLILDFHKVPLSDEEKAFVKSAEA